MMHNPHDRRVACPACGARARERCRNGQGDHVDWNHASRLTAADQLDPAQMLERIERLERRLDEITKPRRD